MIMPICMFVPLDAETLRQDPGELPRTPDESDECYAQRQQIFAALMQLPIADQADLS
jgi:hypothetical protein